MYTFNYFLIKLIYFTLHSWADWNIVMSTRSFKFGMIVANIFNNGYGTFLSNLIMSTSVSSQTKKNLKLWELEYTNGLSHEIYTINFMNDEKLLYVDRPFVYAVQRMYKTRGILLLGIKSRNLKESV